MVLTPKSEAEDVRFVFKQGKDFKERKQNSNIIN